MKLKPLEDRVIIKAVKEEEKTASGIVLPDTAKEKPMMGEVVAAGDGKWDEAGKNRIPMDIKKGDKVIYGKYAGTEYKTADGDELLILRASKILAVSRKIRGEADESWLRNSSITMKPGALSSAV